MSAPVDPENSDRREWLDRRETDHRAREDEADLRRTIAKLRRRVAELESLNVDARDSRRAALNVLEDAVESRNLADQLNRELRRENAERQRSQAALRASDERYRIALEAADMAAWDYDVNSDSMTWNEQHFLIFGLEPDGRPKTSADFLRFVHPDDVGPVAEELRRAVARTGVYQAEFRILRADNGTERWMDGFGRATSRDAEGRVARLGGVMFDVTERKLTQEALRVSEERLKRALQIETVGIVFYDAAGKFTECNDAFLAMTGFTREDEENGRLRWNDLTPPEFLPRAREAARELLETGRTMPYERQFLHQDGSRGWGLFAATRLDEHESVEYIIDIGERKEAEVALRDALQKNKQARAEVEAASRAKDHFLAVLSHELRTPLSPVLMALKTISRRADVSDPVREALAMIRRNIRIESHLIDDLLDITRISRGKLEVVREPLDLHEAIRGALEISQSDIAGRNQDLQVALEATDHRLVGDGMRLQQVAWNLLKNASKFTPDGGKIRIATRNESGKVLIVVSDTGIGMEAPAMPTIFDAFAQGGESVTRKFGGLGLGLAISKATVDAHGGVIRANSKGPGRGSEFEVELPLGGAEK